MANTLIVPNESKISKEELLLGDETITVTDCNGNTVEVHGLTANDLLVKMANGTYITLSQALNNNIVVPSAEIHLANGNVVTVQDIAEGLQEVQYTVPDLQAKYDALIN